MGESFTRIHLEQPDHPGDFPEGSVARVPDTADSPISEVR